MILFNILFSNTPWDHHRINYRLTFWYFFRTLAGAPTVQLRTGQPRAPQDATEQVDDDGDPCWWSNFWWFGSKIQKSAIDDGMMDDAQMNQNVLKKKKKNMLDQSHIFIHFSVHRSSHSQQPPGASRCQICWVPLPRGSPGLLKCPRPPPGTSCLADAAKNQVADPWVFTVKMWILDPIPLEIKDVCI